MMKINKIFWIFLFCLFAFGASCAELNISIDKPIITEGDTLLLTINYDGDSNKKPDLGDLQKDFQIVSNSSSQYVNIINGNVSQVKKWTVGLRPLKTGKISISPIRLDNLISNDIEVEVREMSNVAYIPENTTNAHALFFQIEQSLDNKSPYVQQQVILLATIYDSIGLQDGSVKINDASQKDWIIVPLLDKPIIKQDIINNKQMNVITFAFAAFPQRSGILKTPELSFEGFYLKSTGFDFPDFTDDLMMFGVNFKNAFGQKVPVKMKTKTEEINVKPAPALPNGASWLPLSDLSLSANWAPKTKFKQGEALSRTITLTATGMTESMLPQFSFPQAKGFKQYPEKPIVKEQVIQGKLVTTATINNIYIPTESGELSIPAFTLEWFNTNTGTFEQAVISEETINIAPSSDNSREQLDIPYTSSAEISNSSQQQQAEPTKKTSHLQTAVDFFKKFNRFFYLKVLAVLGLIIFIISCILIQKKKNRYRNLLIKAIKSQQYKTAKDILLCWAEMKFAQKNITNFHTIAQLVQNDEFTKQLTLLNMLLYSDNPEGFDGAKFIEIFKKIDKIKRKKQKNNNILPNLYD